MQERRPAAFQRQCLVLAPFRVSQLAATVSSGAIQALPLPRVEASSAGSVPAD
jgi:hypothetical protein